MSISDPALLATFRGIVCEWCKMAVSTDAAHLIHNGMGGGKELDVRFNVAGLCRNCHSAHHWANTGNHLRPGFLDLLRLISRREKIEPELIIDRIRELQRLPKESERPSWAI